MNRSAFALAGGVVLSLVGGILGAPAQTGAAPPSSPAPAAYVPAAEPGPFAVAQWTAEWRDASRSRTVPVRIYYPRDGAGPFPVIIFSHGLGGSRDGYSYLGERWASRGYVSVHPQHEGSDSALLHSPRPFKALREAAADPKNALDRPKDITFVLDMLTRLNGEAGFPPRGKLDLDRVGVGGHSFGAYTALASAGRAFDLPAIGAVSLGDPRIRACVAMSAPVQNRERDCPGYRGIRIPCLHMTGTEDGSPLGRGGGGGTIVVGDTTPALRRVPFDCIPGPGQYLVIFKGGDHMVFSGRVLQRPRPTDPLFQKLTQEATTAFWDAYLKGDASARAWLAGGGFGRALGTSGTFEEK